MQINYSVIWTCKAVIDGTSTILSRRVGMSQGVPTPAGVTAIPSFWKWMRSVSTLDIYLSKMSGVGDRENSVYLLFFTSLYSYICIRCFIHTSFSAYIGSLFRHTSKLIVIGCLIKHSSMSTYIGALKQYWHVTHRYSWSDLLRGVVVSVVVHISSDHWLVGIHIMLAYMSERTIILPFIPSQVAVPI